MSVATKSYVSSYNNNQHSDEMAQRPRSPASNYAQTHQRTGAPFPVTESNLKRPSPSDDDGEHRGKRQKVELSGDRMEVEPTTLPTNHERQNNGAALQADHGGTPNTQHELQTQTSTQLGGIGGNRGGGPGFGEAFLLCKSSVSRSRPDPDKHLLAMYGLSDLLRSVARTDPHTGDKINKLRKSYEGQIKTFGLPGRNRAEKADRAEDEPGPLRKLATIIDSKWDAEQGKNKIDVTASFRERLKSAMQIQPGTVRNNAEWEDVLGHEKPRLNMQAQPPASARNMNGASLPPKPAFGQSSTGAVSADKRSTRGKKRSYDDESFVGYGEGYSDMDDEGIEGDEYSRRRRKKNSFGANTR